MIPALDVPNLDDGMDEAELREFAKHLRTLAFYAACKAQAMHWRKKGNIRFALLSEQKCDENYKHLPKEWRW